jgi:ABC-type multidrug transport system fused ATPase/permease subunit
MSIKIGDRGSNVTSVQAMLNMAGSQLPLLAVDGIFGVKTRARTLEFQKDTGLVVDGIVGDATTAALKKGRPNDARFLTQLSQLASQAGQGLTGPGAAYFFSHQRALVAPLASAPRSGIVGSPLVGSFAVPFQIAFQFTPQGQLFMLLIVIMMLIVALMLASKDPALRQRGRFWEKEVENLQSTAGEKGAGQAARDAAAKAKQQAREFIDSKTEALNRCKQGNLQPSAPCATALAEVSRVVGEITQKLRQSFDSFPGIAAGIGRNMGELIAALRDVAIHCKGCDDLA